MTPSERPLRILLLHQQVAASASIDERDVLTQVQVLHERLSAAGHRCQSHACSLDLEALRKALREARPDLVFNLVESLGETDSLMCLPAFLLDALQIPYTGSPATTLALVNDKLATKRRLRREGLPTPDFWTAGSVERLTSSRRVIVKAVSEHASFGLDDASVRLLDAGQCPGQWALERSQVTGRPHFCEAFVEGRELNLSLVAAAGSPEPDVLPVAEIDFSGLPTDRLHMVGYAAKWSEGSVEYEGTPRSFPARSENAALFAQLERLSVAAWHAFDLRGYARVDFRVDLSGKPWVLELNANPCLSPDAGFAAASIQAGLGLDQALKRIVASAVVAPMSALEASLEV